MKVELPAGAATGALRGADYRATKVELRAGAATGAFGGAPYGATKRVKGSAGMEGGTACGRCQWGLRWSSL
eukprot:6081581-Pyramimonas_sp.AAC.1